MMTLGFILFVAAPAALFCWLAFIAYLERRRDRIPILLYHRFVSREAVEAGEVPNEEMIWVCYADEFRRQMEYLKQAGFTTIDLDELVAIWAGSCDPPERPIVITIDDGYLSSYEHAFPVLRNLGQKAIFYVALEPDEHTRTQIQGFDGFMNEEQLREVVASGSQVQSHSLTHRIMTELDDEEVMRELTESRSRIESITGRPVRHFCAPRAGYDRRVRRLVGRAGYETGCGAAAGTSTGLSSLLRLPRIVIERDMSLRDFQAALDPHGAVAIRMVAALKRIPGMIGGARFARQLRDVLYTPRFKPFFRARNLKRVVALGAVAYLAGAVFFALRLFGA